MSLLRHAGSIFFTLSADVANTIVNLNEKHFSLIDGLAKLDVITDENVSLAEKTWRTLRSEVYRNTIPQKFSDPATLKMVNADLAMFQAYHDIITKLEFQIEDSMEVQDPVSYSIINSVPGLGFILSLTILYEIDDIHRFSDVGKFISYCRLVKCSHESAGKKEKGSHNKIGNVHLKWAFSEGAVLFLRNNERGQRWHDKLVQRYGKAKVRFAIEFCALFYK